MGKESVVTNYLGNGFVTTNYVARPKPSTLYAEEISALNAVFVELLHFRYGEDVPERGTFILDGQKCGREAELILKFNLAQGEDTYKLFHTDAYSNKLAAASIDHILAWPRNSRYSYVSDPLQFGKLPTGIYRDEELLCLVVNTTFGRFLASFHSYHCGSIDHGYDNMKRILVSLIEVFRQLGLEDIVLQTESENFLRHYQGCGYHDLIEFVRQLFADCQLPALQNWKAWHDTANTNSGLNLFFA